MPRVNGKLITPDEAIAQGRCPETGVELAGVNIEDHIARTWQSKPEPGPLGDEPRRRMKLLRDWTKQNLHLHPKYDEHGELIGEVN